MQSLSWENAIPSVFFHSLSRCNAHHISKDLKFNNSERFSANAKKDENYISFSLYVPMEWFKSKSALNVPLHHSLIFLNIFQFKCQRIDTLAKNTDKGDSKLLKAGFPIIGETIFDEKQKMLLPV